MRRIAYAVHFPMADENLRAELWRRAFPAEAPVEPDYDPALLARTFEIAGGNNRNAALGAAHLAAAEDRAIGMRDVVRAVAREVRKLGRLPSRAEFGALYAALTPAIVSTLAADSRRRRNVGYSRSFCCKVSVIR